MFSSSFTSIGPTSCFLLTLTALFHSTSASLGVVDIHDLLEPDTQQHLSSDPPPPHHKQEKESAKQNGPWSYPLHCTHSPSFKNLGAKYCLHTARDVFINGLSIISTPAAAKTAVNYLGEEPLSYFFSADQTEEWFSNARPWKIVDMSSEGKGKGVAATRKIKKYETFMVDQASVVIEMDMEKHVSKKERRKLLALGIDRLRNPGFVRGLSPGDRGKGRREEDEENENENEEGGEKKEENEGEAKEEDEDEAVTRDWDIMMTNAFGTQLEETNFRGLFPLISRINHACDPNSFVMFSQSGFSLGIKAYRDILPGEEITISYVLLGKTTEQRHTELKRWGFGCSCALCTLHKPLQILSDERRTRISAAEPELLSLWREGKAQAAIRVGEEVVDLMKEEGLTPLLTDEYVILARLHLLIGDRERAEEYAEDALEILEDLGFLGVEGKEGWDLERLLGVLGESKVN